MQKFCYNDWVRTFLSYLHKNQFLAAIFFILFLLFLIKIKGIVIVLFISYILMASLYPTVLFLKKQKIPNILATLIPHLVLLAFFLLLIIPLLPFLTSQIQSLVKDFPQYFENPARIAGFHVDYSSFNTSISDSLSGIGKNIFSITGKAINIVFSALTIFVISFYLLLYRDSFKLSIVNVFPKEKREKVEDVLYKIEKKLGAWARGQVVLSLIIGVFTWIVLTLLQVDFALPLAVAAGILEIIPTAGPILASIPAIIVALTISPALALVVAISYFIIQTIENNILVPKIMEKSVGLNPVVVILAILVGGTLMGVIGALLAIPFLSALIIILVSVEDE